MDRRRGFVEVVAGKHYRSVGVNSVRIYRGGIARLSPDLITAVYYRVVVDKTRRRIILTPCQGRVPRVGWYKVWYSNRSALSGLVSISAALQILGVSCSRGRKSVGVTVGRGKTIYLQL